jgi:hypothetical protein
MVHETIATSTLMATSFSLILLAATGTANASLLLQYMVSTLMTLGFGTLISVM